MATPDPAFAHYCCELLASAGPCTAKRMFGGWGISVEGLTVAIVADLGQGQKLWLKADDQSKGRHEAAFTLGVFVLITNAGFSTQLT